MTRRTNNSGSRSKRQAKSEEPTLLSWLLELGEQKLTQVAEEIASNPRLMEAVGNAFRKAARTKGQVDRNMQLLLNLLNLPSKADYELLMRKLESLQGSLVNLNIKVDRILADNERRRAAAKSSLREGASPPRPE